MVALAWLLLAAGANWIALAAVAWILAHIGTRRRR
jgi:hypothetical protein